MSKTLRNIDYSDHDGGILERIKQSRDALALRREGLSEWSAHTGQQAERQQIDYIDAMLAWLQFGGQVPFWVETEESRQPGERMLEI